MITIKLLDYLILMLLLLKGLLCKHHEARYSRTDIPSSPSTKNKLNDLESDYFKIFSDIKDMRSKVPDYYNTDITFNPDKAKSLLRDPVTYKRTSILNPLDPFDNVYTGANDDDESLSRDQNDRVLKALMDFQKRQDDPMHQSHGVGEGLASLPTITKNKDGGGEAEKKSVESTKDSLASEEKSPKITEAAKTLIYSSDSLGMVRESIEHPNVEKNDSAPINTTAQAIEFIKNRTESAMSNMKQNSTAESAPIKNDTDSFNNTSNIPPLLFQALKNLADENDTTTLKASDNSSSISPSNITSSSAASDANNATTRNMITEAKIKGFLATRDDYTFDDVGKRQSKKSNDTTYTSKISSNLVEVRSNISYAENENTTTHSDATPNNTQDADSNKSVNATTANAVNDTTTANAVNDTVTPNAASNTAKDIKNETIASKLAQMLGNEPTVEQHQGETDVQGTAKTLIQEHVQHFYAPVHLTKVTDEMNEGHQSSRLDASPFTGSDMARKKDNIKAVFQPECSPNKPCPGNKYCRHFECFDCHNKHHECIADEQCCDGMPCIYGRCDKKPKKSPGAICKNDGDCTNGCCVLEPTINIETGICKIKLAEFHQCSPVLYRKVWIGDKKPGCGPCEDGLECRNKGVVATHLVCMKKKK